MEWKSKFERAELVEFRLDMKKFIPEDRYIKELTEALINYPTLSYIKKPSTYRSVCVSEGHGCWGESDNTYADYGRTASGEEFSIYNDTYGVYNENDDLIGWVYIPVYSCIKDVKAAIEKRLDRERETLLKNYK